MNLQNLKNHIQKKFKCFSDVVRTCMQAWNRGIPLGRGQRGAVPSVPYVRLTSNEIRDSPAEIPHLHTNKLI